MYTCQLIILFYFCIISLFLFNLIIMLLVSLFDFISLDYFKYYVMQIIKRRSQCRIFIKNYKLIDNNTLIFIEWTQRFNSKTNRVDVKMKLMAAYVIQQQTYNFVSKLDVVNLQHMNRLSWKWCKFNFKILMWVSKMWIWTDFSRVFRIGLSHTLLS